MIGINVIGHVSGNLGLGVAGRNVVRALLERGCPVAILDLDPGLGRGGYDKTYGEYMVASPDQLPYDINVFVLPPNAIEHLCVLMPQLFSDDRLNASFSLWELPVIPPAWRPALEALDVLVAVSEFIRYTVQFNLSGVHSLYAPHPIYLPDGIRGDRKSYGLPDNGVVFVTSFEPYSDVERKNTRAVIDAFLRGVGSDTRAWLVVKVNNAMYRGRLHPGVAALQAAARGHQRIQCITREFTYAEVLGLYAAADVYVSLHRAEGLGLGMMEAMALGKPVIATGWSGNLSFMDHRCACLVGYRLIPANGTIDQYRHEKLCPGGVWAEPDIEDAAAWMRRLIDDHSLRAEIGDKARERMTAFQTIARRGDFVEELEALWRRRAYKGDRCLKQLEEGLGRRRLAKSRIAMLSDMGKQEIKAGNIEEGRQLILSAIRMAIKKQVGMKMLVRSSLRLVRSYWGQL